jgi:hypothetical protein
MRNYKTISHAVNDLKKRGYTIDFNLGFNGIQSHKTPVSFEITEVYRFESSTDPDDEAVVYAIESHDGYKGTLVNGYGISADPVNDEMISKLAIRHSFDR